MAEVALYIFETYGLFAAVMVAMVAITFRQQGQTSKLIASQDEENKQRDKHLTQMIEALTVHVNNTAQLPFEVQKVGAEVHTLKDELLAKADGIAKLSSQDKQNTATALEGHTKGFNSMATEFTQLKQAIEIALQQLTNGELKLSQETQDAIIDGVAFKLGEDMKQCLRDEIAKITQEAPAVTDTQPPIEAPKLSPTPKPKNETKE